MSDARDEPVKTVHIIGAGRMGQGIALSFIFAGISAVLIDMKDRPGDERCRYFERVTEDIERELLAMATLGLITADQIPRVLERLSCSAGVDAETELSTASLVFEAVPEVMEIKQKTFSWLDRLVSSKAIVASTTSTFLVTNLAKLISHPQRFLNAHWLNPAHLMPLVEVSCGDVSSDSVRQHLTETLKRVGKIPIVCAASAGYIVPRIQALVMSEAVRMADEGVASVEDIDTAVRVGFGLRFAVLGLLEFIDWGGGDILYYASNYLADELDERFRPPPRVFENMQNGRNGLREGQGFYDYRDMDVDAYRQGRIADFTGLLRTVQLAPRFNSAL